MIYWVFFNLLLSLLSLWEWNPDDLQVSCPGSLPLESGLFNAMHVLLCITSKYLYPKLYWAQMIGSHLKRRKILQRDTKQTKGVQQATMCEVWIICGPANVMCSKAHTRVAISDIQLCVVISFIVELFGHWKCQQTKVPVAVKASQLIS